MSTVDDAIEAGARALHDDTCADDECGGLHGEDRDALTAARAMWPILSAPLREHTRLGTAHGSDFCDECSREAQAWVKWPCRTVSELDRIDKALGL